MILSYYIFLKMFRSTRKESRRDKPIGRMTAELMAPNYEILRERCFDARDRVLEMTCDILDIRSKDGLVLKARFFENPNPTDRTVILVHGFNSTGPNDNSIKALRYLELGYNVLLPDNRACGMSEGTWMTFGYKEAGDTLLWTREIASRYPSGTICLDGCSMGGATVCILSDKDLPGNVHAIISDCAYTSVMEEFRFMFREHYHKPDFLLAGVNLWDLLINHCTFGMASPMNYVKHARVPVLFVHGAEDRYVPVSFAKRLHDLCGSEKELLIIDGVGHAASAGMAPETYFPAVRRFLEKCGM